ncbi:MAG: PAS domain-containing protein [Gammaproteobacteria bacterium]|nr:PAS domain-containing protein [Gammaproteobacteria bacterium]
MLRAKHENDICRLYSFFIPVVVSIVLIIVSQINYLLFHTLAELFAVVVAVLMCVVAWEMYPFTRNNYLMYLGIGYFWVGVMDLFHTLMYKGMNIFLADGLNYATDFWIGTRYFETVLLLSAPWFLNHSLKYKTVFSLFGLFFLVLFSLIVSNQFPDTFIEGEGLTDFKIYSEYIIIVLLALAILHHTKKSAMLDKRVMQIIIISIVLTMCAEFAFTFYVSVYGLANLIGHLFKLLSFWLIYMAMVKTTLQEPFRMMARDSTTYDSIPDATIVVSESGIIRQANLAASKLAGVAKSELIGQSDHKWFHQADVSETECLLCQKTRNGEKIEAYEIEFDKNQRWFDFTLSPVSDATAQDGVVEVIRDITGRKLTEQKLDEVSELKDSIIENLPAVLFVKSADDLRYVEWNKAAEDLCGYKRGEMLGKSDYDFFTDEEADSFTDIDKKVLSNGELTDIPEEHIHTKYKGIRLMHTRKIPIFNSQGEASYLLGISQDITEKRESDEIQRRSQKMEVVGQLSGGIAHDFNNQLGIVIGYLEFLKEFMKDNEKQRGWIESASKAAHRCVELTRQLLLFSRTKSHEKNLVDLNASLQNIEDLIRKSVMPEVVLMYQLESAIWPVMLDANELEDAVANIISNSRDAISEGGEIIIRTSNVYLDDEVVINNGGLKSGPYVMLEIKDNGCGMPKEVLDHVFEPFFTTKPVGSGTGLGLSMIYAFVQRYDGTVNIESVAGSGTSVKLYLPRADAEAGFVSSVITHDRDIVLPKGNETILIVDDEQDLLTLTAEYIRDLGYQVFKASNGKEALTLLSQHKFDLLFSDIVMPGGISGFELEEIVSDKYPELKVLLTSGYPGRALSREYHGVVLAKPYTQQDLANQLRRLLDQ